MRCIHFNSIWLDFGWFIGRIYLYSDLYGNSCPHHIIKENTVLVVFQKDGLDKTCHCMPFANEANRLLQPFLIIHFWDDNRNINVTPRIGRTFRVRAVQDDLQFAVETRCNQLLVASNELEGFIKAEYSWSIHCLNCLDCSTMLWQVSSFKANAMRCLCSG